MDKERRVHLQRLWVKLLDNVTDYEGITEELFAASVLTPTMRERVESKHGSRQLREILDILPKRGNHAFDHFYDALVNRGENIAADLLCPERKAERISRQSQKQLPRSGVQPQESQLPDDDELPSKWPDFDLYNGDKLTVTMVSDRDTTMRQRFEKASTGGGPVYCMQKPIRGIFLLLNNQFFNSDTKLPHRDGTECDCSAITNVFRQLKFKVVQKDNLTAKEMLTAIKKEASKDHTNYDCFACAILTHGKPGEVCGVDGKSKHINLFKDAVDGDNCPTLIGKPKLFFIQACQGEKKDPGAGVSYGGGDSTSNSRKNEDVVDKNIAEEFAGVNRRGTDETDVAVEGRASAKAEVCVAMATVEDFVSWRNTAHGTWFVQAIVYVFAKLAYKYELTKLMSKVNRLISKAETSEGKKQVPIFSSTLTGELYFFPGLQHGTLLSQPELDTAKNNDKPPEKADTGDNVDGASLQQNSTHLRGELVTSTDSGIVAQPSEDGVGRLVW